MKTNKVVAQNTAMADNQSMTNNDRLITWLENSIGEGDANFEMAEPRGENEVARWVSDTVLGGDHLMISLDNDNVISVMCFNKQCVLHWKFELDLNVPFTITEAALDAAVRSL